MPTVPASCAALIDEYLERTGQSEKPKKTQEILGGQFDPRTPKSKTFVQSVCVVIDGKLVITAPVETVCEANGRDWKARSRRSGSAWKLIRRAVLLDMLAPYEAAVRAGRMVSATFTRLGGRGLDSMVNLPSALKGVEDAIAYLIGVDDGSPLWRPACDQEPGSLVGVRITLSILEN